MTGTENKETASSSPKISAPEISLPKGGGAISGMSNTFQPDLFSGTGSYSIPINITSARGLEPQLAILYNSGSGNGIFGLGCSLPLSKISVDTDIAIPKYDGTDTFQLDGAGELVKKINDILPPVTDPTTGETFTVVTYLPRIETVYSKIEQWINTETGISFWKITASDNSTSFFGKTGNARIANPGNPTQVAQWLIESTQDATGNIIQYNYKAENSDNVPVVIYEMNRNVTANRYISSIQYGNYFDEDKKMQFAFEVVFDYGEYDISNTAKAYTPTAAWAYRPDPFSSYKMGFEIRTLRLCRNVLLFHHFKKELGDPCLVRAVSLEYNQVQKYTPVEINGLSLLNRVQVTGYQKQENNSFVQQQMPPTELNYSLFSPPESPEFKKLSTGEHTIPGYLNDTQFLPVDLYGDGLPGLLYSNNETTLYLAPQGNGKYSFPENTASFPSNNNLQGGGGSLTDIDGNGQLELVVQQPGINGYYQNFEGSGWENFVPFRQYPTEIFNPQMEAADLNANGKPDLLLVNTNEMRIYFSEGKNGYAPARTVLNENGLPLQNDVSQKELVTFADMFGDGLSHRVRITNGLVECWPCLGYGNFGEKITLGNAPYFGNQFDAGRLSLTDIDGSGTADLVYIHKNHVEIFINESGNSFAAPITVNLPDEFSDIDQIQFADILGNGTNCLLFTKIAPVPVHYYYDFVGTMIARDGVRRPSMKPYLLHEINNNMGGINIIQYCSSVKFALEDKRAGRPWITKLRFPVQVVEETVTLELLSQSRYVTKYRYHDGYYDPVEREFRGFGFVESWDTELYPAYKQNQQEAFPGVPVINEELFVPPIHTKEWYYTGAFLEYPALMAQYQKEFYQGDADAYHFPESIFSEDIFSQNAETVRQAYVALSGNKIRTEIYADDNSPESLSPYTVDQSNVCVKMRQPAVHKQYAVFAVYPHESISYQYERNPADPRVQQTFVLEVDQLCGEVKKSCTVFLPRRSEIIPIAIPATASYNQFINTNNSVDFYYRGVPYIAQQFEVFGLEGNGQKYFSYEEVLPVKNEVDTPVPYEAPVTPGSIQARQLTWSNTYFWNKDQKEANSLGEIDAQGLIHHIEEAVFTKEWANEVFGPALTDDTIQNQGGYYFNVENGYWWNRGLVQYYFDSSLPGAFYLPNKTENGFVNPDSSLFSKTTVEYDLPYYLSPVKMVQVIDEATQLENVVSAVIDYITVQPKQITGINGNISQVLFDPLGLVIIATKFGTANEKQVGGMRLFPYNGEPAEYIPQTGATFTDVITGDGPQKYLQGAASYFYYNLFAYIEQQQPVSFIQLERTDFYYTEAGTTSFKAKTTIQYSDGLGRALETKLETDPGVAFSRGNDGALIVDANGKLTAIEADQRWIVSGRTVYNNKGEPVETYQPWFSNTPFYENPKDITDLNGVPGPTVTFYDPLSRVIRVNTPKGFFSKVTFNSWEVKTYDENDTVKESEYYINFFRNYPTDPTQQQKDEKDALEKAAKDYNTPTITILDSMGFTIRTITNNLGNVTPALFDEIVKGTLVTPLELFNDVLLHGYLKTSIIPPIGTWVTEKFEPYLPGFQMQLSAPYQQFASQVTVVLKQNGLIAVTDNDIQGRVLLQTDPRLNYTNKTTGTTYCNFKYRYAMGDEQPLYINSADGGITRSLNNIFGNQLWALSARDYCQFCTYDRLQRIVGLWVKELQNNDPVISYADFNLVESYAYGETVADAAPRNLRGELYQLNDLSGITKNEHYNLLGDLLFISKQIVQEYKTVINWNSNPLPFQEPEIYRFSYTYNALQQVLTETTPDGSTNTSTYNIAAQLDTISITYNDKSVQPLVNHIEYRADEQRASIVYANGISTRYTYEETTLRLVSLFSKRKGGNTKANAVDTTVQDISYTYDPVGNITRMRDATYQTLFNNNQEVEPLSDYTYDASYRLLKSNGRQHPGINKNTYKNNTADGSFKQSIFSQLAPINDGAKLEKYTEYFTYDDGDNMTYKNHVADSVTFSVPTKVADDSNRLSEFKYDASGNQLQLLINNMVSLNYNYCENLVNAAVIERPSPQTNDSDYYVYDSSDQRARKVTERMAQGGSITEISEKIYFGNYEIKRNKTVDANGKTTVTLERQTLRVMDDDSGIAVIHYWVTDTLKRDVDAVGERSIRFQLDNDLGSVSLEMDVQARLISYEEYFPYGGTAIIAGENQAEVELKEYRYSGNECDDSTGLYYYGARYYVSWLGRWLNPDPGGTVDGLNVFAFVGGNPITFSDDGGFGKKTKTAKKATKPKRESHARLNSRFKLLGKSHRKYFKLSTFTKVLVINPTGHKSDFLSKILADATKLTVKKWGGFYRGIHDEQDELISTSSVREFVSGVLNGGSLSKTEQATFNEALNYISRVRFPTKWSGFARGSSTSVGGDRMQHPTSPGTGIWRKAIKSKDGNPHSELDRQRKEAVLEVFEEETKKGSSLETVLKAGIVRSITFTLNEFTAPPTASDQFPEQGSTTELNEATDAREKLKEIAVSLGGVQETSTDTSRGRKHGDRRGKRSLSPSRK
jgi:RHS repeat-associated protein